MDFSMLVPTWRGWLALTIGVTVAIVIPPLIPAYDGPGISPHEIAIAVSIAIIAAVVSVRTFQKGRAADRVAAGITAAFAAWMFWILINRVA